MTTGQGTFHPLKYQFSCCRFFANLFFFFQIQVDKYLFLMSFQPKPFKWNTLFSYAKSHKKFPLPLVVLTVWKGAGHPPEAAPISPINHKLHCLAWEPLKSLAIKLPVIWCLPPRLGYTCFHDMNKEEGLSIKKSDISHLRFSTLTFPNSLLGNKSILQQIS